MIAPNRENIKTLSLKDIRIDGGTQSRARICPDTVKRYAEDMRDGAEFPPIIVFFDGRDFWLGDGFHRYHAARATEFELIDAEVREGTQRDAVLFSVGTNWSHGLPRSKEDKRQAVLTLLLDEEWVNNSDAWIARQCKVCNHFVKKVRKDFEGDAGEDDEPIPFGTDDEPGDSGTLQADDESPADGPDGDERTAEPSKRRGSDGRMYPSKLKPKGKTAVEKAAESLEVEETEVDQLGQPLTDHNRDAFGLVKAINDLGREMDAIARKAAALGEGPAGAYLPMTRIAGELRNAKRALVNNVPFANCPRCDGNGCEPCRTSGYITRIIYDQLPAPEAEAVEA